MGETGQAEPLASLIYLSNASEPLESPSLHALAEQSALSNRTLNITGYLSYRPPRFTQYVEGPEEALRDLLAKLRNDPRHSIQTIAFLDCEDRRFEGWSMRLLDPLWLPTSHTLEAIDEMLGLLGPGEVSDRQVSKNFSKLLEAI